jgi:hypothetical protein
MRLLCAQLKQQPDIQGSVANQSATLGVVTKNKRKKLWNRGKGLLSRQAGSQMMSKAGKQVLSTSV